MRTISKPIVLRICVSIFFIHCFFITSSFVQATSVTDWMQNDETDVIENQLKVPVEGEQIESDEPSFLWSLVKLVGILILMIGLLYAGVRFFSRRNRQIQDLNVLENLGGVPVGQQKSVQIIRLGNAYYLLGVGENIELLKEIEDELVLKELQDLAQSSVEESLFSTFQRKQNESAQSNSFKQLYTKELDNLMNSRKKLIRSKRKKDEEHE